MAPGHERHFKRCVRHRCCGAQGDQDHSGRRTALGYNDRKAMMKSGTTIAGDEAPGLHDESHRQAVALAIEDISHSYGSRKALDNVSFKVAAGSFTALLGLNGAGKSTLFSIITRLFGMQAGRIRIF